jgi:CRP/FNR family transcriptional regulator, cyclic AMP receptor protein
VLVLDADDELADVVPPEKRSLVARLTVARLATIAPGPWLPHLHFGHVGVQAIGLLVLSGLILRQTAIGGRSSTELLGSGDLLRPFDASYPDVPGVEVEWSVLEPVEIAVLDEDFARRACRYPPLIGALMARSMRRSRALAFQLALTRQLRVDVRLMILFWSFAERWGRVGPEGVRLRLPLTHETLSRLVGARRPSVSTALGQLAERGLVRREGDAWLLGRDIEEELRMVVGEAHQPAAG